MTIAMRSVLLAAVFALVSAVHAEETAKIDQAALLKRMKQKDTSMIVLDVRTPEEYAAGHVPGAINMPYTHLPARISAIPDAGEKDIVIYCATGVRTERAAARFRENGFTCLLHLDGDMKAWREKKPPEAK